MNKNSSNSSKNFGGNTKHQNSPTYRWCFTFNNYNDLEYKETVDFCKNSSKVYIVGKEIGENNTPHLQGYVSLVKKMRLTELKKINNKIHWEPCKGSENDNLEYCSKDGNYVTNKNIPKPLKLINPTYQYQLDILSIITKEPDDRKIYWYWEPNGNTGKSSFTKYLCAKHNAVPIEGKKNDILYCASQYESDIYIFDFERSMEEYISYSAMEKIKNGCYMCSKYESKPIIRNSPHIICFANFEPDYTKLSIDRWIVERIQL